MRKTQIILLILIFLFVFFGLGILYLRQTPERPLTIPLQSTIQTGNMKISSPAFENNQFIPAKYTCDGENINPPLVIEGVPTEAKSLVLIVDDPDAPGGIWSHWVVFNISPSIKTIEENSLPEGAIVGVNDFKRNSYGGPCPPSGTHRYYFRLYALDTFLNLSNKATREDVLRAIENHILAEAQLIGLYQR